MLGLLLGCGTAPKLQPHDTKLTRTPEYQLQIQQVIQQDAKNKYWARLMLSEIDSAIMNDDYDAYLFFLDEYEQIPKEIVPTEYRNEPGYMKPVSQLEEYFRLRLHLRASTKITEPIPPHAE